MTRARIVILMLAAATVGCASNLPPSFYALSARPGKPGEHAAIRLGRVAVPVEMDREQVVRYASDNRLEIDEQHHWAAPLGVMIREVMRVNLDSRAAPAAPPPAAETASIVDLDITNFVVRTDCRLRLAARWSAQPRAGDAARAAHAAVIERTAAACTAADVPAAMSEALGDLSDRIAAAPDSPSQP